MSLNKAIGGYLEMDLPYYHHEWISSTLKFNSARSALVSFLKQANIRKIWLPLYICDTVICALKKHDILIDFYSLTDEFEIKESIKLDDGSLIYYVNYFGLLSVQVNNVIFSYGKNNVIVDNCQAMFCEPFNAIATIYSPRKFFGLPDGGLLCTTDPRIRQPSQRDQSSENRMGHLISRLTKDAEIGYSQYLKSEQAISESPIRSMSKLTERLLDSIDFEKARGIRIDNVNYLHDRLGKYNQLKLDLSQPVAPLCYPFLPRIRTSERSDFISKRVFLPSYWPEVLSRTSKGSFESCLASKALFLPCDQRYDLDDMDTLLNLLSFD